ncbi:hypothetical protein AAIH32_08640, partial [Pseudarthrobacter oxydans]
AHEATIPEGAASGTWYVFMGSLEDSLGNSTRTGYQTIGSVTTTDAEYVTPNPVKFADSNGTRLGTYSIPTTSGVRYVVNAQEIGPGTYDGTGTVTVTAEPEDRYVFPNSAPSQWTFSFRPISLSSVTPTITGTEQVGSVLAAVPGEWGPSPVTLTYQWYRSGTLIS